LIYSLIVIVFIGIHALAGSGLWNFLSRKSS